jgi:hypothetical protein
VIFNKMAQIGDFRFFDTFPPIFHFLRYFCTVSSPLFHRTRDLTSGPTRIIQIRTTAQFCPSLSKIEAGSGCPAVTDPVRDGRPRLPLRAAPTIHVLSSRRYSRNRSKSPKFEGLTKTAKIQIHQIDGGAGQLRPKRRT